MDKSSDTRKTILAIIIVGLIAILTAGGTYAFWSWQSSSSEQTNITFTIARPGFTITGTNINFTSLAPTTDCAHSNYSMQGNATMVAQNNTSTPMTATIVLSGRLTPTAGRASLTTTSKSYIHWAIKEVSSSNLTNYTTANCSGTTNTSSYSTGNYSSVGTSYTDIPTTITFTVPANTNSYQKSYQIYVWIDGNYPGPATIGSTVTDPLQDLNIILTFSETSKLEQVSS